MMADNDKIIFPDEVNEAKACALADDNKIIFPDEVEDAKAAALAAAEAKPENGDSNSVEETPPNAQDTMRNMITVPANCPEGFKMGADGVCREVFD